MTPRLPILTATFAGILVAPMLAFGQATAPTTAPTGPPAATVQAPATVTIQVAPGAATAPATPTSRTTLPTHAGAERRATQIIGASIYNRAGESIGSVDDLILGQGGPRTGDALPGGASQQGAGQGGITAVLSVGTFLGMGGRLVLVPLSDLRYDTAANRWVHDSATRQQLEALPPFTFDRR
jgi:hypothetical protein